MRRNAKRWAGLALVVGVLLAGLLASGQRLTALADTSPARSVLMVTGALALLGLAMLAQARAEADAPVEIDPQAIVLVVTSLTGFVLIAEQVNLVLAIVFLVFVSSLARPRPSIARNLTICAVLIGIAAALHGLLGLDLPLL